MLSCNANNSSSSLISLLEGKLLLHYIQEDLPDMVPLADILKAVGIDAKPPTGGPDAPNAECTDSCNPNQ